MRISEACATFCFAAVLTLSAQDARAFDASGRVDVPAGALGVLPNDAGAALRDADQSVRDALRSFMKNYQSGDKRAAVKQIEIAASKGDPVARWRLARMHAEGDGVPLNHLRAFQLYGQIANAHAEESRESPLAGVVAKSFVALAAYWLEGIPGTHVRANPARARELFDYAASYFGDTDAQYNLARMLLDGVGGPRNAMRGARWMHLAAEKGHMHAQALLGQMLIQGNVMPRRIPEGLMWLKLATEQADPSRDAWIAELHDTAITLASEEDRRRAGVYVQQRSRSAERR